MIVAIDASSIGSRGPKEKGEMSAGAEKGRSPPLPTLRPQTHIRVAPPRRGGSAHLRQRSARAHESSDDPPLVCAMDPGVGAPVGRDLRGRNPKTGTRFWNQAGVYEGARAGNTRKDWSRGRELNPRPTDYESVALPLSYPGVPTFRALTSRT